MRPTPIACVAACLLSACGSATPTEPTTPTADAPVVHYASAGVTIEAAPAASDGTPRLRTHVMLVDEDGTTIATLDLGLATSPATCLAAEAPAIAEHMMSMTFECGTLEPAPPRIAYRVTLVDHRDHVAIWVFLADEGSGNWQRMGDLYVPSGTRVRLLSEPIRAGAAGLAAP